MARIRTVKPEFWANEKLSELPEAVHMLACALLNYADDAGYFNANPSLVKAACFPLRELSTPVGDGLKMLDKSGYIRLLNGSDGRVYGWIPSFLEHQKINRPSDSKIALLVDSVRTHGGLSEDSVSAHCWKGTEGNGRERGMELGAEGETEGEGECKGKPSQPPVPTGQPPLDLSGVNWEWVLRVASDVAKLVPALDSNDRRQWIRLAVLAWTTFSEGWLLDAAEAVLNAKERKRKPQAHFIGVVTSKAAQDGIDKETLLGMMRRIEIPSDVWQSTALPVRVKA